MWNPNKEQQQQNTMRYREQTSNCYRGGRVRGGGKGKINKGD